MYGWLWHRLPGGLTGRLLGSLLLVSGAVAVLLLLVFPRVEPLLPFQNVVVDVSPAPLPTPSTIARPLPAK